MYNASHTTFFMQVSQSPCSPKCNFMSMLPLQFCFTFTCNPQRALLSMLQSTCTVHASWISSMLGLVKSKCKCLTQYKYPEFIVTVRWLDVLRVLFRNPTQTNHLCKYAHTTSWAIRCKLQEFMFNFDNHSRLWLNKDELVLRGGKQVTHQKDADPEIHCKHTRRLEDGDGFPHNSRSA